MTEAPSRLPLEFSKAKDCPELVKNFYEYLKRSYNREPLEFILVIDKEFRVADDPKAKVQIAKRIVDTFIRDGSMMEVNIDAFSKRHLARQVETLTYESENLDTLFDETYKLVYVELKNDSFVRYLDSELFHDFSKKKGDKFMRTLCAQSNKTPIKFTPLSINGNIRDLDITNLLRMAEDLSDWEPLQMTKKYDRAKGYYSYVSCSKYDTDPEKGLPPGKAGKFVGVLPLSALQALYVLLDREYRPRWEPFMKHHIEIDNYQGGDGEYDQTVSYAEIKLLFFLRTRYSAGNTTVMYDSARRCYIWISKTTTGIDIEPLKKKKNPIPAAFISIHVIYKISDTKCRYVATTHAFLNMKDPTDSMLKVLFRKRGKHLFENWVKLGTERIQKYGDKRPVENKELDTLDVFMKKYLPNEDSVKTW